MKKLYTLLVAGALVTGVSAQNIISTHNADRVTPVKANVLTGKAATDTVSWANDVGAAGWQLNGWSSGGFVTGIGVLNNAISTGTAQGYYMGYYFGLASYKIEEVILWCGEKSESGSTTGNLTVNIQLIDDSSSYGNGTITYNITAPGTVVGTATIPWINIDTTLNLNGSLTSVSFASPVFVSSDYAVGVDYADIATNLDTVGFVNNDGQVTDDHQWIYYPGATSNFWAQYEHIVNGGWSKKACYWPVIDRATGIEEASMINGVKMAVSPNPAVDQVKVQYELADNSNVQVQIYDLTGKVVYDMTEVNVAAGVTNNVTIDVSELSAGNYYVSLVANGERSTSKLVLTK